VVDVVERWHIEDSRSGRRAGVGSYTSRARTEQQIAVWRARDARGGRPDIHELMAHLVARCTAMTEGVSIVCPYCGHSTQVVIDDGNGGQLVQCINPWCDGGQGYGEELEQ